MLKSSDESDSNTTQSIKRKKKQDNGKNESSPVERTPLHTILKAPLRRRKTIGKELIKETQYVVIEKNESGSETKRRYVYSSKLERRRSCDDALVKDDIIIQDCTLLPPNNKISPPNTPKPPSTISLNTDPFPPIPIPTPPSETTNKKKLQTELKKEFKKSLHLVRKIGNKALKTKLEMSKEIEAAELEKEAKKLSSKSLFRWKVDNDSAAVCYEKAALIYKQLKNQQKAIECFVGCGDNFSKARILYKAGHAFESAGTIAKEVKDFDLAVELFTKASECYLDDGKGNRAGEALTKAAKMMGESGAITQAIELYKSAVDSLSMGGAYHNAMATYRGFNDFLVKANQYEEAISNSQAMIVGYKALKQTDNVNKTCTSIVILCLALDDYVRAEQVFQKFVAEEEGYSQSKECEISEDLLEAFEKFDGNLLQQCKTNNHLKYLEASIYRLAMKLSIGGVNLTGEERAKSTTPKVKDAKKAQLFQVDDSDEEGDLNITIKNFKFDDTEGTGKEQHPSTDSKDNTPGMDNNADEAFDPNDLT